MEENYGKKIGEAKTLPLAVSGMLMVAFIFLIAGISVMGYGISKGKFESLGTTGIVLFLVGAVLLAYCIKTIMGKVVCYENAIVIKETFKTTVIPRDKIAAIFWERPGANASNEKVRTHVNVADIILAGGRTTPMWTFWASTRTSIKFPWRSSGNCSHRKASSGRFGGGFLSVHTRDTSGGYTEASSGKEWEKCGNGNGGFSFW